MASLVLTGDTSGQVTLAAPAVAGTTTLTLPATTGTVLNDATVGVCRAWVNFAGSSGTRNGNFNISSVTRVGTGSYTVNFTTAMSNANYAVVGSGSYSSATGSNNPLVGVLQASTPTTSAVSIVAANDTGSAVDPAYVYVAIFN